MTALLWRCSGVINYELLNQCYLWRRGGGVVAWCWLGLLGLLGWFDWPDLLGLVGWLGWLGLLGCLVWLGLPGLLCLLGLLGWLGWLCLLGLRCLLGWLGCVVAAWWRRQCKAWFNIL